MDHVEDRIIRFEDQADKFNNWPKKLNKSKQKKQNKQKVQVWDIQELQFTTKRTNNKL